MKDIGDILLEFRTACCDADWYVVDREDYRCCECGKDVTAEIENLAKAYED